jgi:hypothetical protein
VEKPRAHDPEVGQALEERLRRDEARRARWTFVVWLGAFPVALVALFIIFCGLLPRYVARHRHADIARCLDSARSSDQLDAYEGCLRYGSLLKLLGHLPLSGHEARAEAAELEWQVGFDLALPPSGMFARADYAAEAALHLTTGAALGADEIAELPRLLLELGRNHDAAQLDVGPLSDAPDAVELVLGARLRDGDLAGAGSLLAGAGVSLPEPTVAERHALLQCLVDGTPAPASASAFAQAGCDAHRGDVTAALAALDGQPDKTLVPDAAFIGVQIALRASDLPAARAEAGRIGEDVDPELHAMALALVDAQAGDRDALRTLFRPRRSDEPAPPTLFLSPIFPEALGDESLYPPVDPMLLERLVQVLVPSGAASSPSSSSTSSGTSVPHAASQPVASDAGLKEIAGLILLREAVALAQLRDLQGALGAIQRADQDLPGTPYAPALAATVSLALDAPSTDSLNTALQRAAAAPSDPALPAALRELEALQELETGHADQAAASAQAADATFAALGGTALEEVSGARAIFALASLAGGHDADAAALTDGSTVAVEKAIHSAAVGNPAAAQIDAGSDEALHAEPALVRADHDLLYVLVVRASRASGADDGAVANANADLAWQSYTQDAVPFRTRLLWLAERAAKARLAGDAGAASSWQAGADQLRAAWLATPADRALLDLLQF